MIKKATWIWCNTCPQADEYGEFVDVFPYGGGKAVLQISADSNYAAYVNGQLVAFGQYADYPYDKVYDSVDITAYCQAGENRLALLVWYYGIDTTQVYYPGKAGLLYAVSEDGCCRCQSDEHTLSRLSRTYRQHRCKSITAQIGFSFFYDATAEDEWLTAPCDGFAPSVLVDQTLPLRERPCSRLQLVSPVVGEACKHLPDGDIVYDLGREEVGLLQLSFVSPCEQTITVSYGEHLEDGRVRRRIDSRDFSVCYHAKQGENFFFNPFRRLGCRYLEIHTTYPIEAVSAALCPVMYPLTPNPAPPLTEAQQLIYDVCVRTLQLCMHEHYEDCPWREQALYAMDSRNQMLCGYYAFGETVFPRASLQLMSKDNRADNLLSICFPMAMDFVIPSFSLHYITQCREYMDYSGDVEFLEQIYPKLQSIVRVFTDRIGADGLVHAFLDKTRYWNFYEWRDGLDGLAETANADKPDVILNALLSLQLSHMAAIAQRLGKDSQEYLNCAEALNQAIRRVFRAEDGTFFDFPSHESKSELGNALAVLCGAAQGDAAAIELFLLKKGDKIPITLSMCCFKYDALLKLGADNAAFVLQDIERVYAPILEYGATSVWETENGAEDFDKAGSLCHGWSAMPIYYYHLLSKKE